MSLFYVSRVWKLKIRNHLSILNRKYKFKYIFKKLGKSKNFDLIIINMDFILRKEMVSSLKTFDVSKSGKMTELTKTKYRFGILVEFPYNIAYRKGFGISTGNTTHIIWLISYESKKQFWIYPN